MQENISKLTPLSKQHLLILGGNGFIGSNICQKAIQKGIQVSSFNRSGKPIGINEPWVEKVNWIQGDVFKSEELQNAMDGVDSVVSTLGAFGSTEKMEKICGDANIEATKCAKAANVKKFVFISEAQVGEEISTWSPLFGYFNGKQRAEGVIHSKFPIGGICLRPGFVYGWRRVGYFSIPLQVFGTPLAYIGRELGPLSTTIAKLPFIGKEIISPIAVEDLAKAAIVCATTDINTNIAATLDILELSKSYDQLEKL